MRRDRGYASPIARRLKRKRERRQRRRIVARTARFLRDLFSTTPPPEPRDEDEYEGGLGVREPRRPLRPTASGAVALEPPPTETRDVWAVGEDEPT